MKTWQATSIYAGEICSLAFSRDGKLLATGSYGTKAGIVKVWDVSTRKLVRIINVANNTISSLVFSPDNSTLIVGVKPPAPSGSIRFYDAKTWRLITTLQENESVDSLSCAHGTPLAVGLHNHEVVLHDGPKWVKRTILQRAYGQGADDSTSVTFSPNGKYLATSTNDNQPVRVWDMKTRKQISNLPHSYASRVAFSPDSTKIATVSWDSIVILWDAATGEALKEFHGHTAQLYAVSFHPGGKMLASGGRDGIVKIWKVSP